MKAFVAAYDIIIIASLQYFYLSVHQPAVDRLLLENTF